MQVAFVLKIIIQARSQCEYVFIHHMVLYLAFLLSVPVVLTVYQSQSTDHFCLLLLQGGGYSMSPSNLCFTLILHLAPWSPPLSVFLSRGFVTVVKALYQGVDLRCAALSSPFSSPLSIPPWFFFFQHFVKVPPPPTTTSSSTTGSAGPLYHCNIAICSRCCGADNSLFYLSLSSTKGPGHWSNASRLMAAQQAAFFSLFLHP